MEEGLVKNDKLYFDIFNEKLNPINVLIYLMILMILFTYNIEYFFFTNIFTRKNILIFKGGLNK